MRDQQLSGDYALVIMVPHQGDHEWAVVFDDGEDDARVYVREEDEDGEMWFLTAPDISMFFWDLAQTGLSWYEDTKVKGASLSAVATLAWSLVCEAILILDKLMEHLSRTRGR